jgi:hypothetical protein
MDKARSWPVQNGRANPEPPINMQASDAIIVQPVHVKLLRLCENKFLKN